MKDDGAPAKAMIKGTVDRIRSGRCKNESYYRKFLVKYHDSYRDDTGKMIFIDMFQAVVGFNEVARKIKAEIKEGDTVYLVGRLKSRYVVNYETEVFIEVEHEEDITKLPSMGGLE